LSLIEPAAQHRPLSLWVPVAQHTPTSLTVPAGEHTPLSLCVPPGEHRPWSIVVSGGQHNEVLHTPLPAAVPHIPQLAWLTVGSTQTPSHGIVGAGQTNASTPPSREPG